MNNLKLFFNDFIDFNLKNNILNIITHNKIQEQLQFNIVQINNEIILNVNHTVLKSDNGDIFYIANNQFHREDNLPAITMLQYSLRV